ncbi:MAG: zinc-dependent metalloprotease [Actinomycetaceae bacterium]|nr:zinc-dependent metalloprotease [Arcanobacterium sp.]MDD7504930.1 zinc-dependent metalloprotease [Actinomycetaceae bacterium]MDY6143276.1 zinc-dependent metalloprotease [Arcanobacterium sp.]
MVVSLAAKATRIFGAPSPDISRSNAAAVVAELHEQARRAVDIVASISKLEAVREDVRKVEVLAVDRSGWAHAAAQFITALMDRAEADSDDEARRLGGAGDHDTGRYWLIRKVNGVVEGLSSGLFRVETAAVLAAVSSRVLGQFDLFGNCGTQGGASRPRLVLVAPNIAAFRERYNLDRRDVCLWVAMHELTHAAQYYSAPWLEQRIPEMFSEVLAGDLDGLHSEEFARLNAVMSLLEGHAQYVMNHVPISHMPSRRRIITAAADHSKNTGRLWRVIAQNIGLGEKARQYTRGERFIRDVVDAKGIEYFNQVWASEHHFPTSAELQQPALWIARMGE